MCIVSQGNDTRRIQENSEGIGEMSDVCRKTYIAHEIMHESEIFRETKKGDVNENSSRDDGRDGSSQKEEAQENGLI
jgi:hypothetical protein